MVKVELSYNPYLLETNIKFNNLEPKVNSLVEKYQQAKLQSWISKLPQIFYSEMNGYDFDLFFSGTKIDLENLQQAFDSANVSRNAVRIFHKNELESVEQKEQELDSLLQWFNNNPKDGFDYAQFRSTHAEIFDDEYTYVVISNSQFESPFKDVNIVNITKIDQLGSISLANIPILFYVDWQDTHNFRTGLTELLKRSDVDVEQLFFLINSDLDCAQVQRVIQDLGVASPQIINSPSDDVVKKYLAVYQETDYVYEAIEALRGAYQVINDNGKIANVKGQQHSSLILEKINQLDVTIKLLKDVEAQFVQRDNREIPASLPDARENLFEKITNWRRKKIKITSDVEAYRIADEFQDELNEMFKNFISDITNTFDTEIQNMRIDYYNLYKEANFDETYTASQSDVLHIAQYELPDLRAQLVALKSERYVEPTATISNFAKKIISNQTADAPKELVREVTYIYQNWREKVMEVTAPLVDEILTKTTAALKQSDTTLSNDYQKHLGVLIERQTLKKNQTTSQLSVSERKLQNDNDWLATFDEKMKRIERG